MLCSAEFVGGPSDGGRGSGDGAGCRACVGPGGGRGGSHFGVGKPVVLFPFHPAVLKPDFNLPLGQHQGVRDLDAPPPSQIAVIVEFLLQF